MDFTCPNAIHRGSMNPEKEIPALPAGNLAGVRPVIVIDTREQAPLPFSRLAVERGTLVSGDYSFRGGEELFAVERKSIPDLVACCAGDNRDRNRSSKLNQSLFPRR